MENSENSAKTKGTTRRAGPRRTGAKTAGKDATRHRRQGSKEHAYQLLGLLPADLPKEPLVIHRQVNWYSKASSSTTTNSRNETMQWACAAELGGCRAARWRKQEKRGDRATTGADSRREFQQFPRDVLTRGQNPPREILEFPSLSGSSEDNREKEERATPEHMHASTDRLAEKGSTRML